MYIRFGSYTHDLNECTLTFSVSTVRNEQERPVDQIIDWVITSKKIGNGTAAITALETALLAAYSVGNEGNDAYLLANDGSTVVRSLLSTGSLHGVQIDRVDFPVGGMNEYANMRTIGIRLRAVYPCNTSAIVSFNESLSFSGGGPRFAHVQTITGPPIKQQLCEQTPFKATQSGMIVGRFSYPFDKVPPPLFPDALVESPSGSYTSPRLRGNTLEGFAIQYSYSFASATPLAGTPSPYPL
jgi:hypothetical protein